MPPDKSLNWLTLSYNVCFLPAADTEFSSRANSLITAPIVLCEYHVTNPCRAAISISLPIRISAFKGRIA
jgi:hypothetical protein